MQSQQTVPLITDTIRKPWFSLCLCRADCHVIECICFNDTHCLRNSPQKMYPQHNIWIQVPNLLQCRTGSIPTLLWQLPDYQKVQYTFRNTLRRRGGREKRQALLQQFFALLNILLHDFHRNLWMYKQNEYILSAEAYLKIQILTQRDASNRHIPSLLNIQSILNNFQSVSYFCKTKEEIFYKWPLWSQEYPVNKNSKCRNVTQASTNRCILSKRQKFWLKVKY